MTAKTINEFALEPAQDEDNPHDITERELLDLHDMLAAGRLNDALCFLERILFPKFPTAEAAKRAYDKIKERAA